MDRKKGYYMIIRGPAGCGKTTVAKILQKKLKAVYVSFDEILKKHKLEISDGRGISKDSFLKANELIVDGVKRELMAGRVVIFDGCFYHKDQLENLEKSLPFEHSVFDLKASIEECIERDKNRKSIGGDSIRAVYEMVVEFDYGIPVETAKKTVGQVVTELLNML
jgi:adenylate kinase family enzyme